MRRGRRSRLPSGCAAAVAACVLTALSGCGAAVTPAAPTRSACFTLQISTSTGSSVSDALVSVRPVVSVPPGAVDAITSAVIADLDGAGRTCGQVSWTTPARPSLVVTVGHGERAYAFGPFGVAGEGGACGSASCQDPGELALVPERQLDATVCTLTGLVRDGAGAALATAGVSVSDASVPDDARVVLCSPEVALCHASGLTDSTGTFTLRALVARAPVLQALWTDGSDPVFARTRLGRATAAGCAAEPIVVSASEGFDTVKVVTVSLAGDQLAWNPGFTAGSLQVWGSSELAKWSVEARTPFPGPVTYGRVPAGATQRAPPAGPPPPLQPGDRIVVLLSGTAPDGYPYDGHGQYVVPAP